MMSSSKKWFVMLMAAVASLGFQSCLDDDDDKYAMLLPNALVTVKNASDNSCYLQLDERTTLLPVNLKSSPFGGKEVRALVNYSNVDEPSGAYSQAVYVNWIDSLLTKPMAPNLGEAENDEVYGDDPVEMVADWVTIAEDGYLTLRFRTMWGNPSQKHFVNLISTNNPEDPYEVEFRHNAYGDTYGQAGDGLVAFSLASLPDTEGKTVKLTLKWHSFTGDKSVQFDYCTRQSSLPAQPGMTSVRSSLNMK
ncbi:MAG TPA: NigD-like protein [Candidatus Bacteroides pullicola]|uniref:NigD-like protein n=1 Tax=Candidatus Bacteroides pullicola TaxID=2838475 RepID=A0A9D1ZG51_9BACE|nr:NigD-like protein [Candidatus Bacteroides pullicola]